MKGRERCVYFVENLTLWTWWMAVWPRSLRARLGGRPPARCCFFDASSWAHKTASIFGWLLGVQVEKLSFRLLDIRDDEGVLYRLRLPSKDLFELQEDVMERPDFAQLLRLHPEGWRLRPYLAKAMVSTSLLEPRTLWRVLQMIQVCLWRVRQERLNFSKPILFLERRPWLDAICRYAQRQGVQVIPVRKSFRLEEFSRRLFNPELLMRLRLLFARFSGRLHPGAPTQTQQRAAPRIGVEYYGNLHLAQPERNCDLPFWGQSHVSGREVVVLFNTPWDPLDEAKLSELAACGIRGVAVGPHAASSPHAPIFVYRGKERKDRPLSLRRFEFRGLEAKWLREQLDHYRFIRSLWRELFFSQDAKIFLSWFKYTQTHCAIADAMQELGGISAIYQRAFESKPSADLTSSADLLFGFSPFGAAIERGSHSLFRYHIAVGYLGDHRFPLLRERALEIRKLLMEHGARRILAFADENSAEDSRWHSGHELQREHYAFLLKKVLEMPWLGLVVKPKVPLTLRKRLGPVAEMLKEAESTGRCVVFEEGSLYSAYPPAGAALAADLMIHGHLCAVTAGLEGALAGVPSLLLDREGWPTSPLYRLGVGRVIFRDWQTLWKACLEHWNRPGGVPGFGDWSALLPEMDPFRDGRAAERMGTYLSWLLEGFRAGLDRETVMADAAERYTQLWGKDKVTRGFPSSPDDLFSLAQDREVALAQ